MASSPCSWRTSMMATALTPHSHNAEAILKPNPRAPLRGRESTEVSPTVHLFLERRHFTEEMILPCNHRDFTIQPKLLQCGWKWARGAEDVRNRPSNDTIGVLPRGRNNLWALGSLHRSGGLNR